MRKAVVLAMSAPLIVGPATAALAVGPTAPTDPTGTPAVQQAIAPASSPDSSTADGTSTAAADTTDAPPASSEAKPLDVAGIVSIGHTKAGAGPGSAEATGNAIELGGQVVSGGTAKDGKSDKGAIIDTGGTGLDALGQIQVAPWTADTTSGADHSTADATASLAHVRLGGGDTGAPGFVDLLVLGSESHADWTPLKSTSNASSDGVVLQAGQDESKPDLKIVLLHAATSSEASGDNSSYVASINGTPIISDKDVNGQCQIPIPQLITINCVSATGGAGKIDQAASVITGDFVPEQLPDATIVGASGHAVNAAGPQVNNQNPQTEVEGNKQTQGGEVSGGGNLPFTGMNAGLLTGLGAAIAGAGAGAMRLGRRRRTQS